MAQYEIQDGESLAQIARRHGLRLPDLLELNPELADGGRPEVGTRLRLGRGVQAVGPDGKPWEDPGFLANPGAEPGQNAPDPEDDDGPRTGIAHQDPEFMAFLRRMGLETGRIRSDRNESIERLRAQFARNRVLYAEMKREGRTNINDDYSGPGMYFSGGRQRDITDLVTKVNRQRETDRQNMKDNIFDIRRDSQRGIQDWQIDREEERVAARERQTELDLQMATGQA